MEGWGETWVLIDKIKIESAMTDDHLDSQAAALRFTFVGDFPCALKQHRLHNIHICFLSHDSKGVLCGCVRVNAYDP
jgi:hypothetical protein